MRARARENIRVGNRRASYFRERCLNLDPFIRYARGKYLLIRESRKKQTEIIDLHRERHANFELARGLFDAQWGLFKLLLASVFEHYTRTMERMRATGWL